MITFGGVVTTISPPLNIHIMPNKAKKGYVPYKYKSKGNLFIDPVTGLASSYNPRVKGDGGKARLSH